MNIYEKKSIGERIKGNSYVGRGIAIGLSPDGTKAVCAYFIMGRSANSRNRVFIKEGRNLKILPYDATKVEDPSLIIYYPVKIFGDSIIVTNGDQTDTIYDFLAHGKSFEDALMTRAFEPDYPNWTPRISGIIDLNDSGRGDGPLRFKLSILKSADSEGTACSRFFYNYESIPGEGRFIHTYMCDGSPIPTFTADPELVTVPDDIDEFTADIWENLDADNRISLYVRYTDIASGEYEDRLINKYGQEA